MPSPDMEYSENRQQHPDENYTMPDAAIPAPTTPLVGVFARLLNSQIVRFGIVSVVATIVDMALLLAVNKYLPDTRVGNGVAIAAGYAGGTVAHFFLSRTLVFKPSTFHLGIEFALVCLVAVTAFAVTEALILWLHQGLGLTIGVAKVITLFPVFAWNYLGRRYLVYHRA
jgi:putative flippase GtrA